MAKRRYLFIGLVLAVIVAVPGAAQAPDPLLTKRAEAATFFWQGRVREATRSYQEVAAATSDVGDKVFIDYELLQMCGMAEDWSCLRPTAEEMIRLMGSGHEYDAFRRPLIAYFLKLVVWEGQDELVEQFLNSSSAAMMSDPSVDPVSVALAQLALHDWFSRKDKLVEAERSLSTAVLALLAVDISRDRYRVGEVLIRLIRSLRYGNDVAAAIAIGSRARPFIDKTVPHESVLYADMLFEIAEQGAYLTDYAGVAARFLAAIQAIERLDISDERKTLQLATANSTAAASLVLAGRIDEARALHARHPVFAQKDALLARGSFASYAEFYFAVADIFLAAVNRTPPDPRWGALFDKPPGWSMDDAGRREFEAFHDFARGAVAAWGGNVMEGARFWKRAARKRIDSYDIALRRGFEGFPLPNIFDQILVALGADVATRLPEQDGPALLLAGSELANRSLRHAQVDAAVLLDSQEDAAARQDAHSYIQLLRRKRAWEFDRISRMLGGQDSWPRDKTAAVRRYSEMAARLALLKDRLQHNPRLAAARGLPLPEDLGRSLSAESAYVTYFTTLPGLGKLCLAGGRSYWTVTQLPPDIMSDVKLLAFATTASYPPNPKLDAQFPVASALRLREALFGGLGDCLRPGMHLTVALPTEFTGVPLGALLQEAPPRSGDGYDLAKAHWLIRDFSFALVNSAREFLATTAYLRRPPAPRPYLGIGDPRISKPQVAEAAANGSDGAALPVRLADLGELPDTADELKRVGALLAAPSSDILTGVGATEAAFRAKPPGDYDVIHFATHGLLTEEVPGLTEPALVLTPAGGDASGDGLLLASEIFDLSLNARLVVLSACNTARYDIAKASLAAQDLHTAFTVAGVPTLLVSLWPLDSATARDLVVRFFEEWRSPQAAGAADALARATRAYLDGADAPHQHPRFWAPFVVTGNGGVRSVPVEPAAAPH